MGRIGCPGQLEFAGVRHGGTEGVEAAVVVGVLAHDDGIERVVIELNTEYSTRGLSANETIADVQTWKSGALKHDPALNILPEVVKCFRKGGPTKVVARR